MTPELEGFLCVACGATEWGLNPGPAESYLCVLSVLSLLFQNLSIIVENTLGDLFF